MDRKRPGPYHRIVLNERLVDHYHQDDLVDRIEAGFAKLGKTTDDLTIDDLGLVDEFHLGGRRATEIVLTDLAPTADSLVLDVGCGLGGAARYCASTFGCRVRGIDPAPSFIDAARAMTTWVGLDDRLDFTCVTAQALPAETGLFDAAYLLHVGMNVADKAGLFTGIARHLRPGGRLAVYDLMRTGDGEPAFPVPWASSAESSFVESQAAYEAALLAAGFSITSATRHDGLATAFVDTSKQGTAGTGPPPVGLHLVMGPSTPQKIANLVAAVEQGAVAPVELVGVVV